MSAPTSNRPLILLLVGAAAGIATAAAGLVAAPSGGSTLPGGAVARVNDALIRREDYDRMIAAATQDRRTPLDADLRGHVLARLIEEELLVQRGLELGLAQHDRKVRADLTMAVIAAVTEELGESQPTDAELQKFYADNLDFFSGPGRLRVRQIFLRVPSGSDPAAASEKAAAAVSRLRAGEDFERVRGETGEREFAPVPDALLPPAKLRDYVGPTALQSALRLDVGQTSEPIRSSMGVHVLQVLERQPDQAPPFAEIREQVVGEYRRRSGELALRRYLDELRSRADVVVVDELP